ncbi:hypothetical protein HPB50_000133 [Hyalomma asiaticum]|uniref:Uncharacterized protein n=1 Tax=Hyalomma asiaticum TaxID=266040 RepID=A0ACB7RY71_HYAAI|nr:hypothetical protein HPB50_000133 [Hyalomma asiaticum]
MTYQIQWRRNLIVTSTGDEDYLLKLAEVTSIQLGSATLCSRRFHVQFVVSSMGRPRNHRRLMKLLAANDNYTILHATMLGKSSSAVITFEGPHVPYYVKVAR